MISRASGNLISGSVSDQIISRFWVKWLCRAYDILRDGRCHAQKARFKGPKSVMSNFWIESAPHPLWNFSENSSVLVASPIPWEPLFISCHDLTKSFSSVLSNMHHKLYFPPPCMCDGLVFLIFKQMLEMRWMERGTMFCLKSCLKNL